MAIIHAMDQYSQKDFIKLLKKNSQSTRHDLLAEGTDCMRVYDRHQGDFPVTVDLYSDYARIVDYADEPDEETKAFCIDAASRMLYIPVEHIVYSYRAKRQGKEQHEKTEQSVRTLVKESNLEFEVELASYADTGLFLDHYRTRQMIKELCAGMDVLNLFSYTGSFSVYAAAGLAKTVTSVDLSQTYTKWAEENLKRNGFCGENYKCVCEDASKFIEKRKSDNTKYDLIIFDPPSFSNSHKMDEDFDVGRDGIQWIRKLACLLRKNGTILFSTNLGSFRMDKRRLKGLSVQEITDRVMAPGFVKSRKGAVRSWIMTLDDNSLNLDWSDDNAKKSESKKEYGKNEYKPRREFGSDRPRRDGQHSRRDGRRFSDRENSGREHSDREHSERRYSDRPRRSYSEDRPRRRDFDSDRPRRNSSDRFGSERDGEKRSDYSDSYSDRPRRNYGQEDRPRRSFSEDRPRRREFDSERPRRNYSDRFGSERDGERRGFSREDRPRRSYSDDRPGRSYSEDRPRRRESDSDRPKYAKTERRSSGQKPYGYDSFKPARSRNDDDPDLFWN